MEIQVYSTQKKFRWIFNQLDFGNGGKYRKHQGKGVKLTCGKMYVIIFLQTGKGNIYKSMYIIQ